MNLTRRTVPAATALCILLVLLLFRPQLNSDGAVYWGWFSVILDGDLNVGNQYAPVTESWARVYLSIPTENGYIPDVFPIGPATSWLPGFLLGQAISSNLKTFGVPAVMDGYDWITRFFALLMSPVCVILGLQILRHWLKQWFNHIHTEYALISIFLGSPLLYYTCFDPAFSHALEFLIIASLCAIFIRKKPHLYSSAQTWLAGVLSTFIIYTRLQDVGWVAIPLLLILSDLFRLKQRSPTAYITRIIIFISGSVFTFLPQFLLWWLLHGQLLPPYPNKYFLIWPVNFLSVLFSFKRGLFTWSPVFFIALPGLFFASSRLRRQLLIAFAGIGFIVYMSSSASDWWGGGCFGARRFVGSLPVFAAALACQFKRFQSSPLKKILFNILVVLGITWNLVLMILFITGGSNPDASISSLLSQSMDKVTSGFLIHFIEEGFVGQMVSIGQPGILENSILTIAVVVTFALILLFGVGISKLFLEFRQFCKPWIYINSILMPLLMITFFLILDNRQETRFLVDLDTGICQSQKMNSGAFFSGNESVLKLPLSGYEMQNVAGQLSLKPFRVQNHAEIKMQSVFSARSISLVIPEKILTEIWMAGLSFETEIMLTSPDGIDRLEKHSIGTPFFGNRIRSKIPGGQFLKGKTIDQGLFDIQMEWPLLQDFIVKSITFTCPENMENRFTITGLGFRSPKTRISTDLNNVYGQNALLLNSFSKLIPELTLLENSPEEIRFLFELDNKGRDRQADLYIVFADENRELAYITFDGNRSRIYNYLRGVPIIIEADTRYSGEIQILPDTLDSLEHKTYKAGAYTTRRSKPDALLGNSSLPLIEIKL